MKAIFFHWFIVENFMVDSFSSNLLKEVKQEVVMGAKPILK